MVSRIEQFRQSFHTRKTEENDTRQAIQRHDPEFHKKKHNDEEGGFKDPYEDLTDVSVAALITFLEGLIGSASIRATGDAPDTNDTDMPASYEYRPPVDPAHAKAVNAYQTRSGGAKPSPPPSITAPADDKPQTALDKAAAQLDQNEIKSTIRDLHGLLERGIDHIALVRDEGFLQSIQKAIANY